MTLAVLGAVLLLILLFMVWRGHGGILMALVAVLLGVIIAGSGGPLGQVAHATIDGTRTGLTALATAISGGSSGKK